MAFSLLSLDHAQVMHAEDESFRVFNSKTWFEFCREAEAARGARIIHTVNQSVIVPSVLLLRTYDRILLQEMKFNRQNLLEPG